jgi:hypothetical protein
MGQNERRMADIAQHIDFKGKVWRRGPGSNRSTKVLQTCQGHLWGLAIHLSDWKYESNLGEPTRFNRQVLPQNLPQCLSSITVTTSEEVVTAARIGLAGL